ncbi:histone-lysine N-methyltransferase PRDM9 [Denticeps clupeoides]|uniref:Histone-lysine N-methyltransferase PRDM9-like n=1 Tax=Denticeps clupeoides TaxID=299321 RepID=A0AAY4C5T9_9TELE|nr:histone-lysine N-methyltransferase PRDM9-like [Denticeps clupeoides]
MSSCKGSPPGQGAETPVEVLLATASEVEDSAQPPQEEEEMEEEDDDYYCDKCRSCYKDHCEVHGPPLFTQDSPAPMGAPQRALLSLPAGLVIGRSRVSAAALGVFNQGDILPLGMHFGPLEGDAITVEEATKSSSAWAICRRRAESGYLDVNRDTHSNWMKYVQCSQNEREQNVVAFQHRGRILFRCCRPVLQGQELLVWYGEDYAKGLGGIWDQIWDRKWRPSDNQPSQVYPCSYCDFSFPAKSYLNRHMKRSHLEEYQSTRQSGDATPDMDADMCLLASEVPPPIQIEPNADTMGQTQQANVIDGFHCENGLTEQKSTRVDAEEVSASEGLHQCSQCDRSYARLGHLKRHQFTVHFQEKSYRCGQCKRAFSLVSALKRHQQVHRRQRERGKKKALDPAEDAPSGSPPCADCSTGQCELPEHKPNPGAESLQPESNEQDPSIDPSDPPYEPPSTIRGSPPQKKKRGRPRTRTEEPSRPRLKHLGKGDVPPAIPMQDEILDGSDATSSNHCPPLPDAGAQLTCAECQRMFTDLVTLQSHECIQVGEGLYSCSHCNLHFNRSCNLRRHERALHTFEKPYCCGPCGKFYTQISGLRRHQESRTHRKRSRLGAGGQTSAAVFPCTFCQFSFTTQHYLHKHIKRHHPAEFVQMLASDDAGILEGFAEGFKSCPKCDKTFSTMKGFRSHNCFRFGEKIHLCPECGKRFTWYYSLRQHQRIHTGEKPFTCKHCSKSFSHSGQLNVHLRTHTGEKPFLCSECGESFRQSGDLKRHEQKHTGVRPCQCPECGKRFSRPHSLKAHQQIHSGQRLFFCSQCGKRFTRSYHLNRHKIKMHMA